MLFQLTCHFYNSLKVNNGILKPKMPNIKTFQKVFCRWRCGELWMTSKSRLACLDSSPMKASFKPDRIVWKLQERNFCKICLLIANSLCRTLCQKIVRTLRHVFIDFIWRNPRSKSEILTILPFLSLSPQRIWKVEASRLTQRTKKKERKKFYSLKLWTPSWEELLKKRNLCLWDHFFFLLDELDSDTKYQCAKPDSANLLQWWHRPSPSNIIIRGLRANFHKGEYERIILLEDDGWLENIFAKF